MDQAEPFVINLSDVDDLRVKLGQARGFLADHIKKRDELKPELDRVQSGIQDWSSTVAFLESKVPDETEDAKPEPAVVGDEAASVVDLAVAVVNRENRKIRARDVWQTLTGEGYQLGRVQVSNALHYAAHKTERIQSAPGRGFYAPLVYRETVIFDSTNGSESSSNQEVVQLPSGAEDSGPAPRAPT